MLRTRAARPDRLGRRQRPDPLEQQRRPRYGLVRLRLRLHHAGVLAGIPAVVCEPTSRRAAWWSSTTTSAPARAPTIGSTSTTTRRLLILGLWHHYNTTGRSGLSPERSILGGRRRPLHPVAAERAGARVVHGDRHWRLGHRRLAQRHRRLSAVRRDDRAELRVLRRARRGVAHGAGPGPSRRGCGVQGGGCGPAPRDQSSILLDPATGLYYLNLDVDGAARTDVTADLVFPVMFGVADERPPRTSSAGCSVAGVLDRGGHPTPYRATRSTTDPPTATGCSAACGSA